MRSLHTVFFSVVALGLMVMGGCSKPEPVKKIKPKMPAKVAAPRAPLSPLPNAQVAKDSAKVRLTFGGDLSLARRISKVSDDKGDAAYAFSKMKDAVKGSDLLFANVEMVLSDSKEGEAFMKRWRIRADERFAEGLKSAGINVASVSNNHTHDFGAQGIYNTAKALHARGIQTVGLEYEPGRGQTLTVTEVGALRVGFLAYNTHGDEYPHEAWYPQAPPFERGQMLREVEAANDAVDVLVVSIHWGGELDHHIFEQSWTDAKNLVAKGADIVMGSGPHVAQRVIEMDEALVAFSTGDFVFDKITPWIRHRTDLRFLLDVIYQGKTRVGWDLIPMRMDEDWRPFVDESVDVSPWKNFARYAHDYSATLKDAQVSRGGEACLEWTQSRPKFEANIGRWLKPRWKCDTEKEFALKTVALTTEVSADVPRRGIWAMPQDDVVEIRFQESGQAGMLSGYAGIPDWVLDGFEARADPITLEFEVGQKHFVLEVPQKKGWLEFDVQKLQGDEEVIVRVKGGGSQVAPGFLFNLYQARSPRDKGADG